LTEEIAKAKAPKGQIELKRLLSVTEYTVGLNYYLYGHNAKFQGDYSLLDRDRFSGPNRTDHRLRLQAQILF